MMKRVGMLAIVTLALAAPALAQQATVTDQQKRAVQATIEKYITANDAKDAKGLADRFTEDATLVGTYVPGTLMGRPAIEKYFAEAVRQGQLDSNLAIEADSKSFASLGNDMLLVSGTWAGTTPMAPVAQANTSASTQQSGSSQPPSQLAVKPGATEHGSWTVIYVLRGDEALLRSLSYNVGLAGPAK